MGRAAVGTDLHQLLHLDPQNAALLRRHHADRTLLDPRAGKGGSIELALSHLLQDPPVSPYILLDYLETSFQYNAQVVRRLFFPKKDLRKLRDLFPDKELYMVVGSDVITAFYRMESLELWAKITINAIILGGSYDISRENVDKLIDLRKFYRITGRHPGYKKYPRREGGEPTDK